MKTDNVILTSMKKSMKYICMFLMLLGIHVNAWGTGATTLNPGNLKITTSEQTDKCFVGDVLVDYVTVGTYDSKLTIKKNATIQNLTPVAGKITSIVVSAPTYSGATSGNFIIYGGTTAGAKTTAIYSGTSTSEITADFSSYNYQYFYIENNTERQVTTASIVINYSGTESGNLIVYPNTFEIEGELDDGEFSASGQGKFYINTDVLAGEYSYYDEEITSGDDEHCAVDAYGSDDYDGYSYTNNFYLNVWADAAGTYEATITISGYDLAWENELSTTLTVTVIVTAPCTPRSITMSNFSKDFGSADFVPTHTVSAGSGTKTWTSSNTDVATIVDGKVHIVASGTSTIGLTVAEADPYCEVSQSCTMTVNALVPTVTAFTGTSSSTTSITLTNAQVSNKGGAAISAYGYIYSTTASTTEALKLGESGVSTATVASADIAASTNFASKTVSELTTGTTYYVRAYATNSAGTGYSAIQSVKTIAYTDYKFSCADWSITGPSGDIVFITSAASKTVRSQEAFHVSGNGLPHSTALTFSIFPASSKFVIKKADGTIPSTDEYGVVDADVYVFYTPDAGDTSDGLDELTSLTVSVTGEPRTATIDTKRIIGRHLPADFVIAAKNTTTNKWYALPANMSGTGNPVPVEIAVDDINNPTIAYTAASNVYNLYLSADKEKVQLGMKNNVDGSSKSYALWANNAVSSTDIGKNTGLAENTLGDNYKWTLTQTNTSITNPQDAKYTISNLNNVNPLKSWFAAGGGPKWGLYANGVAELRLIPASNIPFTEAYFVEWAQHGGVIEVDATAETGVDATSVVAHLGEATSSAITLVQTKASDAKNKSSKYNYTENFGGSIDFAANEGQMLTLEWKNGETVKAVSNIVVPKIIASNITINKANYPQKTVWNTEVHVLPGKTVTVDADYSPNPDVTIKELNIYPGATVVASTGTLIATNLVLRNGWSRAGEKTYDVARLFIQPKDDEAEPAVAGANLKATNVYADWYIDYDQYYPVAVPWNATIANFTYRYCTVSPSVGPSGNIRLRYYDGENRAKNIQVGVGEGVNWKEYGVGGNTPVPATLTPSSGYVMTAKRPSGKAFSIIRMPLTLPSGTWGEGSWTTSGEQGTIGEAPSDEHKDQISVTAHNTGSTPIYAQGWNLIANPYMAIYKGTIEYADETKVQYVNIPDVDFKEYNQLPTATTKLAPASAFLIQAPKTGTITFGTAKRVPSAPSYRKEEAPASVPEQQAYIVLNNEQTEDMMGILVSDQYTAEYEINADLEKLLGDGTSLRTYMRYGDRNMAYLAINKVLAQEWIPVSVRLPQTGEYTFSLHEASIAGELEGVYLIDYVNGDRVTNLINENYVFTAEAGTINGRFAINATVGERQTPTDIDVVGANKNGDEPIKFLYHDKVFIWHRGVIYDATGKKVREINK